MLRGALFECRRQVLGGAPFESRRQRAAGSFFRGALHGDLHANASPPTKPRPILMAARYASTALCSDNCLPAWCCRSERSSTMGSEHHRRPRGAADRLTCRPVRGCLSRTFDQPGGEKATSRKHVRSRFRKIRKATGYMLHVTGFKVTASSLTAPPHAHQGSSSPACHYTHLALSKTVLAPTSSYSPPSIQLHATTKLRWTCG